jgi:cytochrome c biogenesis protein
VLRSRSPAPLHPAVAVFVYRGDLGLGNGIPQNVYTLDARQIAAGKLRHIGTATLTPGQTKKLPGGVRVTFDGYTQWANFQISHNPGQNYLLLAALGIVTGLLASLSIRRRRVWLRLTGDAVTEVEVGGLARIDSGNFPSEFSALLERLRAALPTPQSESDPMLQGTRE